LGTGEWGNDHMTLTLPAVASPYADLVSAALTATASARNEKVLVHGLENALKAASMALGIPFTSFSLDMSLRTAKGEQRYLDALHGTVVIEYEPPDCFGGGSAPAKLRHAHKQAEEYAEILGRDEGRDLSAYTLCAWDGSHISFGNRYGVTWAWVPLTPFNKEAAKRLMDAIAGSPRPLVAPLLLASAVGPNTDVGATLLPALFAALVEARKGPTSKTKLLLTEWTRLFGQAVGIQTNKLKSFLQEQERLHGVKYGDDIPCYLFALHTFIGLTARLVAALSLRNTSTDLSDAGQPVLDRLKALESGTLFTDAGVVNMLNEGFFSWYVDDAQAPLIEPALADILSTLAMLDYDTTKKDSTATRDLFKGIYSDFVPRELRHALGEVYTPDWLAAHALDQIGWQVEDDLLDPNGGSGTFLLEALRRRIAAWPDATVADLLHGLYAIDLNPLAVLCAKASIVVTVARRLDPVKPLRLPVFLGDAINVSTEGEDGIFSHTIQTEKGDKTFRVPAKLVRDGRFHALFDTLRVEITANLDAADIYDHLLEQVADLDLTVDEVSALRVTVDTLVDLHKLSWDGIWCPILADRFAAGAIPRVSHIAGNPPWVKWSHLPPKYAAFIQSYCRGLRVFSDAKYVGGIEADISTVITFSVVRRWLAEGGRLAFYITGTVFTTPSSQGFRRFAVNDKTSLIHCEVLAVEDFKKVAPFEDVTNHTALILLRRDAPLRLPVPYKEWELKEGITRRQFKDGADFRANAVCRTLLAAPVPGTDAGPWAKGTATQHAAWSMMLDGGETRYRYEARKGVTVDLNGVLLPKVLERRANNVICIVNDPSQGRTHGLPVHTRLVEDTHLFPLVRGKGLAPFRAEVDPEQAIIVPQRGMHGDPTLPKTSQRLFKFLSLFRTQLEARASYRKYQKGKPFWSVWSTGSYTFSPYKVLWREMGGMDFCAAYVGTFQHPVLGRKTVVPNHKVYFVPCESLREAQFLTAILNASSVVKAVGAFATALSLGTNVIRYLRLPRFNWRHDDHLQLALLAGRITARGGRPTRQEAARLDELAIDVLRDCSDRHLRSVVSRRRQVTLGVSSFWNRHVAAVGRLPPAMADRIDRRRFRRLGEVLKATRGKRGAAVRS
jgi:hypothetical protein